MKRSGICSIISQDGGQLIKIWKAEFNVGFFFVCNFGGIIKEAKSSFVQFHCCEHSYKWSCCQAISYYNPVSSSELPALDASLMSWQLGVAGKSSPMSETWLPAGDEWSGGGLSVILHTGITGITVVWPPANTDASSNSGWHGLRARLVKDACWSFSVARDHVESMSSLPLIASDGSQLSSRLLDALSSSQLDPFLPVKQDGFKVECLWCRDDCLLTFPEGGACDRWAAKLPVGNDKKKSNSRM